MRIEKNIEKIGILGKPSLIFGKGQQKRFDLVKKFLDLKGKRILDIGCGIGIYTKKFFEEGAEVFGVDIDPENIKESSRILKNIYLAKAENLPFEDNFFDIVFFHEVLEHFEDDRKSILEAFRVLKKGGVIVIFAPNRRYFFETHGIYLGKKYIYKLIPFINWFPIKIRNFFCPHVKIYNVQSLKKLFRDLSVSFLAIDYIYPPLDKFKKRFPKIGTFLSKVFDIFEENRFLKKFGISIFMIVKKI